LKPGDQLILTKPIGSGIINTAIKGGFATAPVIEEVTHLMATLNRQAAEAMNAYPVHACTDITGFGFLGHLAEMVIGSGCSVQLLCGRIPIIREAVEYASMGLIPAGAFNKKAFRLCMVDFDGKVDPIIRDILFDPQTSGGLLFSIPDDRVNQVLEDLHVNGCQNAVVIGRVIPDDSEKIVVDP
jgi:selenide,water dikinase